MSTPKNDPAAEWDRLHPDYPRDTFASGQSDNGLCADVAIDEPTDDDSKPRAREAPLT